MWYVIQVQTGSETEIAEKLKEKGVRGIVPRENRLIRKGGEWGKKEYVLFPGYVFIDIIFDADTYYKIKNMPGVVQFLGDNNDPSTLSYMEAEWILLLTGEGNSPIEPTIVKMVGGVPEIVSGVLEYFPNKMIKFDRRSKKASFEITICGETKVVQLSIVTENEEEESKEEPERKADDFMRSFPPSDESPL